MSDIKVYKFNLKYKGKECKHISQIKEEETVYGYIERFLNECGCTMEDCFIDYEILPCKEVHADLVNIFMRRKFPSINKEYFLEYWHEDIGYVYKEGIDYP